MAYIYPLTSNETGSLNSGSYLNETDYNLFNNGLNEELWFGISDHDYVELFVYDLNKNLINHTYTNKNNNYKTITLTYYDDKNNAVSYDYKELIFDKPLYKNEKILVNPIDDLNSINLSSGNYTLAYQFTRLLAGSPSNPLTIKEISSNKTELKIITSGEITKEFEALCTKKTEINNVAPLYLKYLKAVPYNELYINSQSTNEEAINLVKNLFFIPNDGKFIEFLQDLYEDYIRYDNNESTNLKVFFRIQGIQTFFSNFLVSNSNNLYSFDEIKSKYINGVNKRLDILFKNYTNKDFIPARTYLYNYFVDSWFNILHSSLEYSYNQKYNSPLKNALITDNGSYYPIVNTSYTLESINGITSYVLLVKLQNPLPDSLSIKSSLWIANIGMTPYLFNCIVKISDVSKTIKIGNPDFTTIPNNVSLNNVNEYYTETSLTNTANQNSININKKINELNVDYTDLNNFVVFSSAELRHNIFKNKMITLANTSASLSTLEINYSSSNYSYPYYTEEKETLQTTTNDTITSFDGFESYLYKTNYYTYYPSTNTYFSQSYIEYLDEESKRYDKYNRDSLINNTPEYIITDSNNDDYLIFLSMIGHYFDNLYLYIKSIPTEKYSEDSNALARNILQQMLTSFGWSTDSSLEMLNASDNFLDKESNGSNTFSAEEKTRQIWNRILNTLPLIYKTKGTEECIKYILSCYGIPSTLINIKEYGGTDYTDLSKISYSIDEKLYMLNFKGTRDYISVPFDSTLKTIEFKTSLDDVNKSYNFNEKVPLAVKYNQYNEIDWVIGVYKEYKKYMGRVYFELAYPTYQIGLVGNYGLVASPTTQSIKVASSLINHNPDIIVSLGDNTYLTTTAAYDSTAGRLYHEYMNPYTGAYGSAATVNRFYPSIGNADYLPTGGYAPYLSFFSSLPTPTSRYYTFTKGNIQFFMINSDSNEPSGTISTSNQATWFKNEMSSSIVNQDILWRVAVFHHPFTSSGISCMYTPGSTMNWPWNAWGIDLVLNGQEHNYERLEANNVPIINQGAGGYVLYSYSKTNVNSRFKYNALHSYSLITSKGNTLKVDLYDMNGTRILDTGSVTLPSCSIENGSFVMTKLNIPFSDKPFGQLDKYILSDSLPIFSGDIFNVMLRKNTPDALFEYNATDNLLPLNYDLWVQRKDQGRTIYSSSKTDILTKTYNNIFTNTGKLYFGNYINSSSFVGLLDKILLWDTPITNATYEDHCFNINSYSYTGSTNLYNSLYFRMNFDYPQDLSTNNPHVIVNSNELYSSSISASAYNFAILNFSSSLSNCVYITNSVYPYQFDEISYNQTLTINSYGPNTFKNEKIQKAAFQLDVRLDPIERSTNPNNDFIAPDSNQLGLFADPNDYKNKDIFRYYGNRGIVDTLADPELMYEDNYQSLKDLNTSYNNSGNKRTYYNEMFSLYKFYFDKSIFETIKQVIPARNNVLTGILIEPTVLERPKYQYKKLNSEVGTHETSSHSSPITSSLMTNPPIISLSDSIYGAGTLSSDVIYADFNIEKNLLGSPLYEHVPFFLQNGPYALTDPVYIEYLKLKNQLVYVPNGWIKQYPLFGELNNIEQHTDWPIPSSVYNVSFGPAQTIFDQSNIIPGFYYTSSGYYYLKGAYFYVKNNNDTTKLTSNLPNNNASIDLSYINDTTTDYSYFPYNGYIPDIQNQYELELFADNNGKVMEPVFSGSSKRYLLKKWTNHTYYQADSNNVLTTQSISLSTIELWNTSSIIDTKILLQPTSTSDNYFELFKGYSRNHLSHKKINFTNESYPYLYSKTTYDRFIKSRQTIDTTVDESGIADNSLPVESFNVSNINIVQTDNVIG